jgi:hypothetical protein
VAIVAATGTVAMFVGGRLSGGVIVRAIMAAILLPILASELPAFRDGVEAFQSRWETGTTEQGGVQVAIVERVWDGFTEPFHGVGAFGLGTGFSTNVGQKLLTNEVGFGAAEGEWGRLLFDNGFILGCLLIGYRIALAGLIIVASVQAWQRRSPNGLIFASAAFLLVLNGQWGQATTQGAAVIAGGLALAAAGDVKLGRNKPGVRSQKPEVGNVSAAGKGNEAPFAISAQSRITEP